MTAWEVSTFALIIECIPTKIPSKSSFGTLSPSVARGHAQERAWQDLQLGKTSERYAVIFLLHFQRTLQSWVPKDKVGKRPIELCYFYVFARVFHFPELSWVCVSRAFLCFSVYMFIMQLHCVRGALISACSLSMSKRWHTHDIVSCCFASLRSMSLFLSSHCASLSLVLVPCLLSSLVLLSAYWHRFDKQHTLHLFPLSPLHSCSHSLSPPPAQLVIFLPWHVQTHALHGPFGISVSSPWGLAYFLPALLFACLSFNNCVCVCVCVRGLLQQFSKNTLIIQAEWKMFIHNEIDIVSYSWNTLLKFQYLWSHPRTLHTVR